jgi:3-oxoacyl-[acyl-carrier protein] reductase
MVERQGGHVVTIGSMSARGGFAGGTAYVGAKHFVLGFSESLLLEVRDHGVKVSVVMPGSTNTGLSGGGDAASWKLDPAAVADVVRYVVDAPGHTLVSTVEVRPLRPPRS